MNSTAERGSCIIATTLANELWCIVGLAGDAAIVVASAVISAVVAVEEDLGARISACWQLNVLSQVTLTFKCKFVASFKWA